jgi:hypothetical protein
VSLRVRFDPFIFSSTPVCSRINLTPPRVRLWKTEFLVSLLQSLVCARFEILGKEALRNLMRPSFTYASRLEELTLIFFVRLRSVEFHTLELMIIAKCELVVSESIDTGI